MKDQNTIADIEARNRALAIRLGGDKSAYNIDRILRVAGTTNYPTAAKRKKGRVECYARWLIDNGDLAYELEDFPPHEDENSGKQKKTRRARATDPASFRDCKKRAMSFDDANEAILADAGEAGEWARRSYDRAAESGHGSAVRSRRTLSKDYVLVNAADVVPRPLQWLWAVAFA